MVLVKFVCLLDKRQAPEKPSQPVNAHCLVVAAGEPLEGAHGIERIKIRVVPPQQTIKRDTAPVLPDKAFGKGTIERIGMGKAAVLNFDQGFLPGLAAAAGNAAQEKTIPFGPVVKKITGRMQGRGIYALEKNIVFKDQNAPGSFL